MRSRRYETVASPSLGPSVRPPPRPLRRVCCCGPGGREISISCCTAAAQQQMRTVSRCQLNTDLLAHALVSIVVISVLQLCCSYNASRGKVSAGEMIQILLTYGHRGSIVISQTTLQCLVTGQKHCSFIDGQERGSDSCYMHLHARHYVRVRLSSVNMLRLICW